MLSIDSQIWIYYFDPNAPESQAVTNWFEGTIGQEEIGKGRILDTEEIVLSAIIPIEVAHALFRSLAVESEEIEHFLRLFLSHKQIRLVDVNSLLVWEAVRKLKLLSGTGVGGRDALILATMDLLQVETIASHDKELLSLKEYTRIDPVFQPPLVLEKGEAFSQDHFKILLREQYGRK